MAAASSQDLLGKKIFFLFPSGLVQNEVIPELAQLEYEVYSSSDEKKLKTALKKYPGSIVFINIDDGLAEKDWDAWIQGVMRIGEWNTAIGILSSNNDEKKQKKYITALRVQAGYVPVKSDITKSIQQIIGNLRLLDAKGRRKYIRVTLAQDPMTSINIPYDGSFLTGQIMDISVVGLSCVFTVDPQLSKGTQIKDIQIKLQGIILKTEGIVFGSRQEGKSRVYVFIFTARIDPDVKTKIRKYMQSNLQSKMDAELN
jgi:hypothetical protein